MRHIESHRRLHLLLQHVLFSNNNSPVEKFIPNLTTRPVFPLTFFVCIPSSLSVCDLPVALSSYRKLTAPVPASLTSWCLQVSRPSPPNQRRSPAFLPRGSAPSAHAHTAWLTAARSETEGGHCTCYCDTYMVKK